MSDTTGWTRVSRGTYSKLIDGAAYWIFMGKRFDGRPNGYWFVRQGHIHGRGYVGEWHLLADAKRAAHKHAEEKHP